MADTKIRRRSLARRAVMTIRVAQLQNPETNQLELLQQVREEFFAQMGKLPFTQELLDAIHTHQQKILELITVHAPQWPIDKLSPVDRAILEIGITELILSDAPLPVVINEAVEIAKEYGDEGSSRFVNGVLNTIGRELAPHD